MKTLCPCASSSRKKGLTSVTLQLSIKTRKLMTIQLHLVQIGGTQKGSFTSTQLQAGQVVRLVYNTAEDAAVPFCVGTCPAAE